MITEMSNGTKATIGFYIMSCLSLLSIGLDPKAKFSAVLDMIFEWSLAYWIFIGICYLIINSFNK